MFGRCSRCPSRRALSRLFRHCILRTYTRQCERCRVPQAWCCPSGAQRCLGERLCLTDGYMFMYCSRPCRRAGSPLDRIRGGISRGAGQRRTPASRIRWLCHPDKGLGGLSMSRRNEDSEATQGRATRKPGGGGRYGSKRTEVGHGPAIQEARCTVQADRLGSRARSGASAGSSSAGIRWLARP